MIYLDTSALVSIVLVDAHSAAMLDWSSKSTPAVAVSSFGTAEFAAVVSTHVRTRLLTAMEGERALVAFDTWVARSAQTLEIAPEDHHMAVRYVRLFDLGLRAPDALHIAVCQRLRLSLLTFDKRQAAAAVRLGVVCDVAG